MRTVTWKRVVDLNDRALRDLVVGLGGVPNGYPREDGFDIVVASELMAIFCLTESWADLKRRIGDIVIGYTRDKAPVTARDLEAHGAMTVLLRDALAPNLVQTLEHSPAFVHGGPFANIAHGCSSVIATRSALRLADFVVTEAGFGADLGAEKFVDIKCRKSGLVPDAAVVVATVRALKYHGGVAVADVAKEDLAAVEAGMANLRRHLANVRDVYGIPCVVALNRFPTDTDAEVDLVVELVAKEGVRAYPATHFFDGGAGAAELAEGVLELVEEQPDPAVSFTYDDDLSLAEKVEAIAGRLYGTGEVTWDPKAARRLRADRGRRVRPAPGLHRQDPVLLLHRPAPARRPRGAHPARAGGPAVGRCRVRRRGLRGRHDDARAPGEARRRADRPHRRRRDPRTVLIRRTSTGTYVAGACRRSVATPRTMRIRRGVSRAVLVSAMLTAVAAPQVATADSGQVPGAGRVIGGPGHAETYPSGLETTSDGGVVLADTAQDRIERYDSLGQLLWWRGGHGAGAGQLTTPRDIGIDTSGNIYVADTGNTSVVKFSSTGAYLARFRGPTNDRIKSPIGITVVNNRILVADAAVPAIRVLTLDGVQEKKITSSAGCPFAAIRDVTQDAAGNFYVANYTRNNVLKLRPDGTCLASFGVKGTGSGQWKNPYGVAVARDPHLGELLYVADSNNNRIQVLRAQRNVRRVVRHPRRLRHPRHVRRAPPGRGGPERRRVGR